jgi:hypothetical protein
MARRRARTDQRRACTGKKPYATKAAAEWAVRGLVRDGAFGPLLQIYPCKKNHCGSWHVGHKRRHT